MCRYLGIQKQLLVELKYLKKTKIDGDIKREIQNENKIEMNVKNIFKRKEKKEDLKRKE